MREREKNVLLVLLLFVVFVLFYCLANAPERTRLNPGPSAQYGQNPNEEARNSELRSNRFLNVEGGFS